MNDSFERYTETVEVLDPTTFEPKQMNKSARDWVNKPQSTYATAYDWNISEDFDYFITEAIAASINHVNRLAKRRLEKVIRCEANTQELLGHYSWVDDFVTDVRRALIEFKGFHLGQTAVIDSILFLGFKSDAWESVGVLKPFSGRLNLTIDQYEKLVVWVERAKMMIHDDTDAVAARLREMQKSVATLDSCIEFVAAANRRAEDLAARICNVLEGVETPSTACYGGSYFVKENLKRSEFRGP